MTGQELIEWIEQHGPQLQIRFTGWDHYNDEPRDWLLEISDLSVENGELVINTL
ncbi:hypothetical protein [Nocardia jiangxiensis]|uniref:hypothetical protein n=1 Tax=Nocardia jiangxiensis TaxID=282685 RepID=UPI0002D788CA|nr:hypothetical protein [Nocardia jiangxiensis]